MRIVHLSDIHVWRYPRDPRLLASKRLWGVFQLAIGRARRFRLERLEAVVGRIVGLRPDHVLITGDLTTTALPEEFLEARRSLGPLLEPPSRATVVPGNHDRYTGQAARSGAFEEAFGALMPGRRFPWLRRLDRRTAIVGLDATRAHYSARGRLPPEQLEEARGMAVRVERLIVACHYPLAAPAEYRRELAAKRLENGAMVAGWLRGVGPHLYCCGHVHAAWAFEPPEIPRQLCLNAGAPLLRDRTGSHPPGFLEIALDGGAVTVRHHGWDGVSWQIRELASRPGFFPTGQPAR
jgi:hypothetical protein